MEACGCQTGARRVVSNLGKPRQSSSLEQVQHRHARSTQGGQRHVRRVNAEN